MKIYCPLFFILCLHIFSSTALCEEKITLQLPDNHQFQFAGYYAAVERRYYRDAGFEVILVEGGRDINTVEVVINGNAQFGITNSELIVQRAMGKPVVSIASIFQHSALVFLTKRNSGIQGFEDFSGKKIIAPHTVGETELLATLKNEGLDLSKLTLINTTPVLDFHTLQFDIITTRVTDHRFCNDMTGRNFASISPSQYGIDLYGDTLFTRQQFVEHNHTVVDKFTSASLKGWRYAIENQEEIARLIYNHYASNKNLSHLLSEAREIEKLIQHEYIELGSMNPERWKNIAAFYTKNGFIEPGSSLDGFLLSTYKDLSRKRIKLLFVILFILAIIISTISIVLLIFNKRLQKEISTHEKTALQLKKTQQELALHMQQMEQFSLSAASILTIKDEQSLFQTISDAIVKFSDYERVLISLFNDSPPYRTLIGFAGISHDIVEKVKKTDLNKSWYDKVFKQGVRLGQFSYYIPHTMKHILNQQATIYGNGEVPKNESRWHPEDNLFVKMSGEDGEFLGVISVDNSKSGVRPTNEIVRPLEIYASLISQLIILRRTTEARENLEQQLRQAQKMEAIGILTGGIAHDFNNILGILIGNTELALEVSEKEKAVNEHLQEILAASIRARDIVKHLLAFSRKSGLSLQPVAIKEVLDESITFIRSTIPSTIRLITDLKDISDCTILADKTQLHQIILNLGTNATHAMEHKGDCIEISARKVILKSSTSFQDGSIPRPGEYVMLEFSDNGCGIPEKDLDKIFDPYFTTKDIGKGTGMGLSVVHGIVQSHRGVIDVSSFDNAGTTFSLYFPLSSEEISPEKETTHQSAAIKAEILLVDDEQGLLDTLAKLLRSRNFSVHAFADPKKALEEFSLKPRRYDLVITDMTMPVMSGEELATSMLKIREDIPIFLCTGYSDQLDKKQAHNIGIRRFFLKPMIFQELLDAIYQELDATSPREH